MVVCMTSDYLERIQDPLKLKLSGHVRAARLSACASASAYADDHPRPVLALQLESTSLLTQLTHDDGTVKLLYTTASKSHSCHAP
jgi:hypothetical protein